MNIHSAIKEYKVSAKFFAPDYDQENEVLIQFKRDSPTLAAKQITELVYILKNSSNWPDKFFVADLLYLYESFDLDLVEPLLENAIEYKDPSFNRIFLRPAVRVYGAETISEILTDKFVKGDVVRKMNITALVYWIQRNDNAPIKKLEEAIALQAKNTDNVIELYYYNRYLPDQVMSDDRIPNNANELIKVVKGNPELEQLLFEKLGWGETNAS